jgi:hypothetical protein
MKERTSSMKKLKRLVLLVYIIVSIVGAVGCSNIKEANTIDISEKIKITLANTSKLPEGTGYSLKLKNNSPYMIKQNVVYVSYPIKSGNGVRSNKCKVEAIGNKLDIKPNEEVMLSVFMPIEHYKDNPYLDTENPQLEIIGYINKVTEENRFQRIGDISFFNK